MLLRGFDIKHCQKLSPQSLVFSQGLHLEAIWWTIWVSGEKYIYFLYCAISVAQIVKELQVYESSNIINSNFLTICVTQKCHSSKNDILYSSSETYLAHWIASKGHPWLNNVERELNFWYGLISHPFRNIIFDNNYLKKTKSLISCERGELQ